MKVIVSALIAVLALASIVPANAADEHASQPRDAGLSSPL